MEGLDELGVGDRLFVEEKCSCLDARVGRYGNWEAVVLHSTSFAYKYDTFLFNDMPFC